jgi:MFS superfamily sulfate permease-like transporter
VAVASGATPFSGIIAGIVGGIVVGLISGSPLSVSGPAAGLTTIILAAIQGLPSYEAFLLAVFLAGCVQIVLGLLKAGIIGDFIPNSAIRGMLAAIGIILILKQIPHALGYDKDYQGDFSFVQSDGENTFSEIFHLIDRHFTPGAIFISLLSIAFLFWWDSTPLRKKNRFLQLLPGPLVVVVFGVVMNEVFRNFVPDFVIEAEHLVGLPAFSSFGALAESLRFPDFSLIAHPDVWKSAVTIGLVASMESLLSIEAVDKLDPYKRITPTNRELLAQGAGNISSSLLGGIPVTSVIVRSSANVSSGGRTQSSTILHGSLLLICVLAIPTLLNKIPLAALAAVLITTGYKLAKPDIFIQKYKKGWSHLIPFIITILAILFTDLLKGVVIGSVVSAFFIVYNNYKSALTVLCDGDIWLVRFHKGVSFVHKAELKSTFKSVPDDTTVIIDMRQTNFVDLDNVEIIKDFAQNARYRNIQVEYDFAKGSPIERWF